MSNPLLAYRRKRGLSQRDVADLLKVSRQMVSFWETGKRNITAEMALNIEQKLGIDRVVVLPSIFRKRAA